LHICVCDVKQLFLRINSKAIFQPVHPLLAVNNSFLHHDSYVELTQLVRHMVYEIGRAEELGTMVQAEARALVEAVKKCNTLSDEHKRLVEERLY
jgi:hypothetical protein